MHVNIYHTWMVWDIKQNISQVGSFPQVRASKERKDSNHQVANVESHVHACSMLETALNSKNAGCPSKGITPEIRRIE